MLYFPEELLELEARGDVIPRGVQENLACFGKHVTLPIYKYNAVHQAIGHTH